MDGLAPSLKFCLHIRLALESGESAYTSVKSLLPITSGDFHKDLVDLIIGLEKGDQASPKFRTLSPQAIGLLELISFGLRGQPILEPLRQLEDEMIRACEADVERNLSLLPLKGLLFLMLLQFPAFLLLLLGPFVSELIKEIQ